METYKIDLRREKLAWCDFLVLFQNLPENAPIVRIITLRKQNPNEIKDLELRRYRESILLKNDAGAQGDDPLLAFANALKK